MLVNILLLSLLAAASATVYFSDDFSDADWQSRWVSSEHRPAHERGKITLSAGKYFTDETKERGLKTSEDARHYTLSAEYPEFTNKDNSLVLQFSLKQDQRIDCGGGYIKLHPVGLNQKAYNGDSEYNIMFGPDVCGGSKRIHAILTKNGVNHLIKNDIPLDNDIYTHVYTFILESDNTYEVLVDNKVVKEGSIEDDWAILEPKKINDPAVSKPKDWVDETHIDDPQDVKPEGYDDILPEIVDPEAEKPEDWDDELDGEWEAPIISNPAYKGPWKPKRIPNPTYKGEWVHPQIDNPKYVPDSNLYAFDSFKYIGIEVWQVKSGSVFGNFLITDSPSAAKKAATTILARVPGEKAAEKTEQEAAAAATKEAEEDDDDEKEDL